MYKLLLPIAAIGLSACGGGSTTDPNNFIISTPTGTTLTAPQPKSFSQPASGGGSFALVSGSQTLQLTRTNTTAAHLATYTLVVNGVTYNLTPASGNSATKTDNSFVGSTGGTSVSLFLNENMANASIANAQLTTGGTTQQLFGIVGSQTPTATLASIASASYSGDPASNTGTGEVSIDKTGGAFDDAPNSTVTMNADFTGGTVGGSINVTDPAGDVSGSIDIAGSATLNFTGTISGGSFTANVDHSPLVAITTGLNSIDTSNPVEGAFYGTNAENAVGVGLNLGTSSTANDVLIYTRIQATKN